MTDPSSPHGERRHLTLVRHAEAAPARDGEDDRERALTERGRRAARALAARLEGNGGAVADGPAVDAVVSSDATRTRQTLEVLAPALGRAARDAAVEGALYLAGADALAARADAAFGAGARHALIVGHNPGLERLYARLVGAPGATLAPGERVTLRLAGATASPGDAEPVARDAPAG